MQALRAPSRNPIAQFTVALPDWAVKLLRRVIPGFGKLDWSSLVVALAFEFVLQLLLLILAGGSALDNPNVLSVLLFMSFVKLVRLSIYVFMGALIIGVALSWVNPHHPVAPFFDALINPFMKPVRRGIPPIRGFHISPLLVFLFFPLLLHSPATRLQPPTPPLPRPPPLDH